MNKDTIKSLMKSFIEHDNFLPLYDKEEHIKPIGRINVMVNYFLDKVIIIELIDCDLMSGNEIQQQLKKHTWELDAQQLCKEIIIHEVFLENVHLRGVLFGICSAFAESATAFTDGTATGKYVCNR